MADPLSPPAEDPFAQIDPSMGQTSQTAVPTASVANDNAEPSNPFADLGPEAAPGQSGYAGSFLRGVEKGAVPALTTQVGLGAGAEIGEVAGPVVGAGAGGYIGYKAG